LSENIGVQGPEIISQWYLMTLSGHGVPPLADIVMQPLLSPLQVTFDTSVVMVRAGGSVIHTVSKAVHPLQSVTITT
jgi:hypothetical protein